MSQAPDRIRIDKWLWHARFFKTRGLATKVVAAGHVRVNSEKIARASHLVGPGDVLTFAQAGRVRIVKVIATSTRRGPAPEAQALYEDQTPAQENVPSGPSAAGKGRPTKKDRREMRLSRDLPLD